MYNKTANRYDYGITFNGKHSSDDFQLDIMSDMTEIIPEKNINKIQPPYSNETYYFGGSTYKQRKRTITFRIRLNEEDFNNIYDYKNYLHLKKEDIDNWIYTPSQYCDFWDDLNTGYYYKFIVEEPPTTKEEYKYIDYTVTFIGYPFRIKQTSGFDDTWDIYNLDSGFAQETFYTINGTKEILLRNDGANDVMLYVKNTGKLTIELNDYKTVLDNNVTEYPFLFLNTGENKLILNGVGTVDFGWYEERI